MNVLLLNIMLALMWVALTGGFTPGNMLFGFGLGYFTLWAVRRVLGPSTYFTKVPQVLSFGVYFVYELVLANLRLAVDALTPTSLRPRALQPRIVGVPLDAQTDGEITLLANLISLTPGTLTLDVSTDERMLYVHVIHGQDPDQVRREIKDGLERRLLNLMRGPKQERR